MNYTFRYNCQHRVFSNSDLPKRSTLTQIPKSNPGFLYVKFTKVNFELQRSKIKTCDHYQINESGDDEFWYSDEYSELFETYNGNL